MRGFLIVAIILTYIFNYIGGMLHWPIYFSFIIIPFFLHVLFCFVYIFFLRKSLMVLGPILFLVAYISNLFYTMHWELPVYYFNDVVQVLMVCVVPVLLLVEYQKRSWQYSKLKTAYFYSGALLFAAAVLLLTGYFYPPLMNIGLITMLIRALFLTVIIISTEASLRRNRIEGAKQEQDFLQFVLIYAVVNFFILPIHSVIASKVAVMDYY